jgi:hypothetical protein
MFLSWVDEDLVVVARGGLVAQLHVDDGDVAVVLLLHVAIAEAERAQQLDAADLEPDDEVRVVDHAHLVGLGVAHAELCLADHQKSTTETQRHRERQKK